MPHLQVKMRDGARLETSVWLPAATGKFPVVLTRTPPATRAARILTPPDVGKAEITAKLCTVQSVELAKVPRRDKAAYASARRWRWGDAVIAES